jgi:limonene-1,2-epoxide hydrolase
MFWRFVIQSWYFFVIVNVLHPELAMAKPNLSISEFFNSATKENMREKVEIFYRPDIRFEDPIETIEGRDKLLKYYQNLYENVIKIRFDITKEFIDGDEHLAVWVMHLQHRRLADGKDVVVPGTSHVRFVGGQAIFHRDYLDLGAMLYEHLPVIGSLIRWVKGKAAVN